MDLLEYRYEEKNCLDFLKELPDNSIKLVVTSPPYNVGKAYENVTSLKEYLQMMEPIIKELCRVLREDGSICWEVGNCIVKPTKKKKKATTDVEAPDNTPDPKSEVYPLDIYYYQLFKKYGLQLRNRIVWHFEHGLQCTDRLSGRYETILWFTKSDSYTFNLDQIRVASKYPGKKQYKGPNKGKLSGNFLGKNPSDLWKADMMQLIDDWDNEIWDVPNVKSNHPEKVDHPCQFPIELVERCILALTNEGDIVYDPFCGVASTVIAALKNFRIGYGTELKHEYIVQGNNRIQLLREDNLPTRRIGQAVYDPKDCANLSSYPVDFIKAKLSYLENMKKQVADEIKALNKQLKSKTKTDENS